MSQQIQGIIRHGLTFVGGYVVAKGWLSEDQLPEVIGSVITLVGVFWSWKSKPKTDESV